MVGGSGGRMKAPLFPSLAPGLVLLAGVWLSVSCGGAQPAAPSPPATPVPPSPSPSPIAANGCPLGNGDVNADCGSSSPLLLASVETAIDALVRDRPELFNTREEAGVDTGQYRVLDPEAYLDGVVARLRASGLCAERTLSLENIVLKSSNQFSEEWDVLTAGGFVRRGGNAYQTTCTPASFPVEPRDLIAYVRTHLWGYECPPEITPPTPGDRQLPVGCDGRVTATPKLRDGRDVPARIHGPDVTWELREGGEIVTLDVDPRFPDNPFDKILRPSGRLGGFQVCASVLGKVGCLDAQTIP